MQRAPFFWNKKITLSRLKAAFFCKRRSSFLRKQRRPFWYQKRTLFFWEIEIPFLENRRWPIYGRMKRLAAGRGQQLSWRQPHKFLYNYCANCSLWAQQKEKSTNSKRWSSFERWLQRHRSMSERMNRIRRVNKSRREAPALDGDQCRDWEARSS